MASKETATGDDGIGVVGGPASSAGAQPPLEDLEEADLPPAKKKASNSKPGEKVRTPDTKQKDFEKLKGGNYRNKKTGEIWSKSHTKHSGAAEWKVGLGKGKVPTKSRKVTVVAGRGEDAGKIIKVDK